LSCLSCAFLHVTWVEYANYSMQSGTKASADRWRHGPLTAQDGRLRIGYQGVDAQPSERPGPLLDSCASVVVVCCRGVAKLVEHAIQGLGHPRM
jgi:hypothetical protein